MEWKPSPPALVRVFEKTMQSFHGAERRKMFGYPAVFINGNMFVGLVRNTMILRLSDKDRERFLEIPGAKPFIAMKGRVMKQWVIVPPAMLKTEPDLKIWLVKALAYGGSLPPKVAKQNRRTGE